MYGLEPIKGVRTFSVKNVSEALYLCKQAIEEEGVEVETRNGPALEFETPVAIVYNKPCERVLFYPQRDANPVFHLMESLWMLAGRNDVEWITQYNSNMNKFSDDGEHFYGAYGHRWKKWFNKDQLEYAVHRLLTYKNDRRTVVSMWDPYKDVVKTNDGKDYPCNTQIFFKERNGKLDITVINRSNDMIWGALGSNAVHMSILQEYMAAKINAEVGIYTQFSNNFHAYLDTLKKLDEPTPLVADYDAYAARAIEPFPLVKEAKSFDGDLNRFFTFEAYKDDKIWRIIQWKNPFFPGVIVPMHRMWKARKAGKMDLALTFASTISAPDWAIACTEWLTRRIKN
jgi:hypothetical protein|tara:strand:- start:15771 stop:16796 length:1026 start_codon:yes stop_codon:yes gene_type:complete